MTSLQHMCVCVLVTQLCLTLCNLTNCSPPGFSVPGILQARILEWIAIPFSRGSSRPRDRTLVSCTASRFFTIWDTGKSHYNLITSFKTPFFIYRHHVLKYWDFNIQMGGGHRSVHYTTLQTLLQDSESQAQWPRENMTVSPGQECLGGSLYQIPMVVLS